MTDKAAEKEMLDRSTSYYDSRAKSEQIGGESYLYYEWIMRLLGIDKINASFLDLGCGGGALLESIKKDGLKKFGADLSYECAKSAKRNNPDSHFIVAIGEKLPFKDESFDYIACSGVLEHFFRPASGVNEMSRILKSNGRIVIMVPNKFQIKDIIWVWKTGYAETSSQPIEHQMTKNEWSDLFRGSGLKLLKIYKYNGFYPLFIKGTFKIKSLRKYLFSLVSRYLVPFNLSYSFVYVCGK